MWPLYLVIILGILYAPNLQETFGIDFEYNTDHVPSPLFDSFSGPLLANSHLSKAEKLFVGELLGPECFAQRNGKTYTSTADGRIVELLDDSFRTVVHLDPNNLGLEACREIRNSGHCARPLGIKFDSKGALFAVDPYNGIFKIDVDTGKNSLVLNISETRVTDGSRALFLDDLAIVERPGKGHEFYLSDASQKWLLYDVGNAVSEAETSGRLLKFDADTGSLSIVAPDLAFPNGLQLTDDGSAIVLCIFSERRLVKFHLSTGAITHFAHLPGEPDNVKRSKDPNRETYLVGLYTARNRHNPSKMLDKLGTYGKLKRFGFRVTRMIGSLMVTLGKQLSWSELENLGFFTKIGGPLFSGGCEYGMIVEVDSNGQIVNSLHSPDAKICSIAEGYEYENTDTERKFYIGSFSNEYLGRLILPKSVFRSEKIATKSPSAQKTTPTPKKAASSTTSQSKQTTTKQPKATQQSKQQQSQHPPKHQEL